MKQIFFILTILFFGCSAQKERNDGIFTSDSLQQVNNKKATFRLTSTTICDQPNLSHQFDISINCKRYTDTIEQQDSCLLKVFLKDKTTKSTLDSISITSFFFLGIYSQIATA